MTRDVMPVMSTENDTPQALPTDVATDIEDDKRVGARRQVRGHGPQLVVVLVDLPLDKGD